MERARMSERLRLGINVDHVATLRNARGGAHPDPVRAAKIAKAAGADSIVCHLREDRRHIRDADLPRLLSDGGLPVNLEMAATPEMHAIALAHAPFAVCLVPERRQEITTEGGLDVIAQRAHLADYVGPLTRAGCRVSLFIDPEPRQLEAAKALGAPAVELHTGAYCEAPPGPRRSAELARLERAAKRASELGVECHAGHGLTYDTVGAVARIPEIVELNIGHYLVGEAVFVGFEASIRRMRALMDAARSAPDRGSNGGR
jgi:pyridoxine 5-phosphate synthase